MFKRQYTFVRGLIFGIFCLFIEEGNAVSCVELQKECIDRSTLQSGNRCDMWKNKDIVERCKKLITENDATPSFICAISCNNARGHECEGECDQSLAH